MSQHNLPDTNEDDESPENNPVDAVGSEQIMSAANGETESKDLDLSNGKDTPIAQLTGKTGAVERQTDEEFIRELLSDRMYGEASVVLREFAQNAETACLMNCRLELKNHPDYGAEWLSHDLWVDAETGETIADTDEYSAVELFEEFDLEPEDVSRKTTPRSLSEVVRAARDIGYDPTIEVTLKRDERMLVFEDNGIGMTANVIDGAFNYTGRSLSKGEGDTGGMFGAGVLTFGSVTGKDSGMITTTRTRKDDVAEANKEGIKLYTYLGGFNEMDNSDIPDDFYGTKFEMPLKPVEDDGPVLDNFEEWAEKYFDALRVPVQYLETESGENIVKEEYGGESLVEKFSDDEGNEPPVVIERPGEFTAVAGPKLEDQIGRISYNHHEPNTWLVSMPIERNTSASVKSFWEVAIQIHNEQNICVAGPDRGILKQNIEDGHEDNIYTPGPTTDRDRLLKDDINTEFFEYVSECVAKEELDSVSDTFQRMLDADHPVDVIQDDPSAWKLFYRMTKYHGRGVTTDAVSFAKFIHNQDAFPHIGFKNAGEAGPHTEANLTVTQIYHLFDSLEHAPSDMGDGKAAQKGARSDDQIGDILSDVPKENVYMAASTSGYFAERRRVVRRTHDKWTTVVVKNRSRYSKYEERFGFKKLKDVPRKQSDDHDYVVPQSVHDSATASARSSSTKQKKPNALDERTLKIRYRPRNNSIDARWTIEKVREKLEKKGGTLKHNKPLVLFPSGKYNPNISDHYDVQDFACIASCSQAEYEQLADTGGVFTLSEFMAYSLNTVIATDQGGRTVRNLVRDDEMVVLAHASRNPKKVKRLLKPENAALRQHFTDEFGRVDQRQERDPEMDAKDADLLDVVFGVADRETFRRAAYGLKLLRWRSRNRHRRRQMIRGLRFSYDNYPVSFIQTTRTTKWDYYEMLVSTPNWRDDSEVYDLYEDASGELREVLEGFHDAGIDPTVLSEGEIQRVVSKTDPSELAFWGDEPEQEDGEGAGQGSHIQAADD